MEEGKADRVLPHSWFLHKDEWVEVDLDEDENSNGSSVSLSSCDTTDDASSSSSSGSLNDLSDLMIQLPIKRGLSEFYQGRSESFTSLSRLTSVEDLAKKPKTNLPFKRKRKGCDDHYKPYILPKPIISKANKKESFMGSKPSHKKIEC